MFVFPYKFDSELARVPIVTTLVCLVCFITYFTQQYSWHIYQADLQNFCRYEISDDLSRLLTDEQCIELFAKLDLTQNTTSELQKFQLENPKKQLDPPLVYRQLEKLRHIVSRPITVELWYQPESYKLLNMLTSKLSHLTWQQMLFNIIFFAAFAVSAEQRLGHLGFVAFLLGSAIISSLIYSTAANVLQNQTPSVGLSSVVTATMMLVTVIYPHRFVRIFFWMIFFSGTFRLPIVLVSISYLGSDFYTITVERSGQDISYVCHAAGILIGTSCGLILLLSDRLRHKSDQVKNSSD